MLADAPRLDLKAVRLAVHGWWLGNPLVYKPGVADLVAVARELAGTGAASGTLIVDDETHGRDRRVRDVSGALPDAEAVSHESVHAILILRPPLARAPLGAEAAFAVAEVAQAILGRLCAVRGRWEVVFYDRSRHASRCHASRFCSAAVDENEDIALVDLRLAFRPLWQAAQVTGGEADQPSAALLTRPDWREVFLARVLHTLDGRLRALSPA